MVIYLTPSRVELSFLERIPGSSEGSGTTTGPGKTALHSVNCVTKGSCKVALVSYEPGMGD